MAITGTGTETDPYLVSTAEELRACLESDGSGEYPGEYIQLAKDIDKVGDKLKNTKIGIKKTIIGTEQFNKIRNIYHNTGYLFILYETDLTFQNIHFENLDLFYNYNAGIGTTSYGGSYIFKNSTIQIHLLSFSSNSASCLFNFSNHKWCSVNFYDSEILIYADEATNEESASSINYIGFTQYPYNIIGQNKINNTRIVYDFSKYPQNSRSATLRINALTTGMDTGFLSNSYIIIKTPKENTTKQNACYLTTFNKYFKSKHCYASIEKNNIDDVFFSTVKLNDIPATEASGYYIDNFLLNCGDRTEDDFTIKWQNIDFSTCPGVKQLTTEQLKDPDYLNSIYWYVNKEDANLCTDRFDYGYYESDGNFTYVDSHSYIAYQDKVDCKEGDIITIERPLVSPTAIITNQAGVYLNSSDAIINYTVPTGVTQITFYSIASSAQDLIGTKIYKNKNN